jgi:3-mercaptopyruvate sulfurtransferase SseA
MSLCLDLNCGVVAERMVQLSYEAVAVLRARGFKARRLEDGLPEWRAAGLPVETSTNPITAEMIKF